MAQDFIQVTASLEGMKVIVTPIECELYEYNFEENSWRKLETAHWPLSSHHAERWLRGWNHVDQFAAFNYLVSPESE